MNVPTRVMPQRWQPPSTSLTEHNWQPVSRYEGWTARANHVVAGYDLDGSAWFVARLRINNRTIPGKAKSGGVCHLLYNGLEVQVSNFEVLRNNRLRVWWQSEMNGLVPPEALTIGSDSSNNKIFIGKCLHVGVISVGIVDVRQSCLCALFNGKEQQFPSYEVLCGQPE